MVLSCKTQAIGKGRGLRLYIYRMITLLLLGWAESDLIALIITFKKLNPSEYDMNVYQTQTT